MFLARANRRELAVIIAILLVSFFLHALLLDPKFDGPDAISNFMFAKRGQDWSFWLQPDAFWSNLFPMGYGSFLALLARLTGGSLVLVQWLQIVMALMMAIAGWSITRHVSKPARLLTLAAIAFSPSVLWLSRTNGYEVLLAFTVTISFAILWGNGGRHVPAERWQVVGPLLAGFLMGVAMLSQGKVAVLLPLFLVMALRWGRVQALVFVFSATLLPLLWSVRNLLVLNRFYPFNSSSEVVIWMGNNWTTEKGNYVADVPPLPDGYSSFYAASLDFVLTQPEKAFELLLIRMGRLLEPTYIYLPDMPQIGNVLLHFVFIALAVVGAFLFAAYSFGRLWVGPPVLPPVGAAAVAVWLFILVHLPFATETRHINPIVPLALCVTTPTAVALITRAMRARNESRMHA